MSTCTIDRRSFMQGASLAAASLGACALTGTAPADAAEPAWDIETDVVVVGSGAAGCCAAIAACQEGAEALILEKAPYTGGNTADCVGAIHSAIAVDDVEGWIQSRIAGSQDMLPEEDIRTFVNYEMEIPDWLYDDLDMDTAETPHPNGTTMYSPMVGSGPGNGHDLAEFLVSKAEEFGAQVMLSTPVVKLVKDWGADQVIGVVAQSGDETLNIKARRGVVLACGGYENDPELQSNVNFPGIQFLPWGTPYNTGDGIRLAGAVGAQMWHFGCFEQAGPVPIKAYHEIEGNPAYILHYNQTSFTRRAEGGSFIMVNRKGQRFMNENKGIGHQKDTLPIYNFTEKAGEYDNFPFFFVCDQKFIDLGPLAGVPQYNGNGYSHVAFSDDHEYPVWSNDNQAEVEAGLIMKADTVEELAALMEVDPEGLAASVAAFNDEAAGTVEPAFGRPIETILPLEGPFYAVECGIALINTQGGAKRNAESQILDYANAPIPRLYGAGEFGSFNGGYLYMFGNVAEAITSGRIAGMNAAKLEAWC